MEQFPSFNEIIEKSIITNWDLDALTDYKGKTLQYHDVARKIEKLHIMFEASGVQKEIRLLFVGEILQCGQFLFSDSYLWGCSRTHLT